MWEFLLKAVTKYIESHPDMLVQLIEQAVQALINDLKKRNTAQ